MPVALQIIAYLVSNREQIKDLILALESLAEKAVGPEKGAAIKGFIASAMGIESQIEAAWPMVAPFFNLFVKSIKTPHAA
jgi:hypothetical protein